MDATSPKPNRTPWIIAGVLGCLVVCLLLAVIAGGAYFMLGNNTTTVANATATRGAVVPPVQPTVVVPTVVVPTVVVPTVVIPTIPPVQPTVPLVASATPQSAAPTTGAVAQATIVLVPPTVPTTPAAPTATTAPTQPPAPAAPKGRIAFTVRRGDRPEDNYIWIMNADGSGAKQILTRSSEPSFSPDGNKLVYYHWTDGIFVANADGTDSKKVIGETNSGYPAWSHDGRWIAFSVRPGGAGNITTDAVAPDGTGRRPVVIGFDSFWSPDDTTVVFQTCRGGCGIFKGPSSGGDAIPIITDDGGLPAYSPDGKTVLYQKDQDGAKQLFLINADGTNKRQLTSGASMHVSANWSADGNFIFYRSPEGGQWGIWRMNANGSNPVKIANDMPPGDWPYDRIAVTK